MNPADKIFVGNQKGVHPGNLPLPLTGIRLTDFSWVAAGPWCTRYLAAMGAEVIKIESTQRIDFTRNTGPFAEKKGGLNRSSYFNMWNQSKKSCTININHPQGRELAKRLVKISDIAVENFGYGTLEKLGLGYSELTQVKSDLIMLSSSGFGRSGPFKEFRCYGRNLHAASGLVNLCGYEGGGEPRSITVIWADVVAGLASTLAILMALYHREQTGEGQYIDNSMVENCCFHLPEPLLDWALNGREWQRKGNSDETHAPQSCYRCYGDDQWVAISVSNEKWPEFCKAIGNPPWCQEERFANILKRIQNRKELDRFVNDWTKKYTPSEVVSILQSRGIAAGVTYDLEQILGNSDLYQQGTLVKVNHPEVGWRSGPGLPWRLSLVPNPNHFAAPLLGEHNSYVFLDLLKMSKEEVAELTKEGAIQ